MVILIILAVAVFGVAGFFFLKAFWLLLKAGYYYWFASEKELDKQLHEIESKTPEYKNFERSLDNLIK